VGNGTGVKTRSDSKERGCEIKTPTVKAFRIDELREKLERR
jgi:hypothetical protein